MAKKFQVPTIGGLRKVVMPTNNIAVGTTIAEFGSSTVTLAQLAAALGVILPTPGSQTGVIGSPIGPGASAIVLGPGLSGGGALLGPIPINLTAPSPVFLFGDGDEGPAGVPGTQGTNGTIGRDGAIGPATYLMAEAGEDGMPAIPGSPGPAGATGASGGQQFGAYWVSFTGGIILPVNAVERVMNASGTIKEVIIVTKGGVGSCTVSIYKAALSSHYPPVPTDDITGGANVVLTSGIKYQDSVLSGWTTTFSQDDCFLFTLSANVNFSTIGIFLRI